MREMLGNYKEAIKDFEEAARYLPNDANVHLNLANARGMVAQFEGRYADAVRYFEQALRYSPNNATVKENLRRAQVSLRNVPKMKKEDSILAAARDAEAANDWIANERYLRAAYKACTGYGCEAFIPRIHRAIGRQALIQKNWDAAIRELKQSKAWYVDQERKYGKAYGISYPDDIREMQKLIDVALAGKAHEEEAKKAEAQHKADEQRREQASNPNYPKPPPVYRNAKTPRDYPDLGYYTPAQHKAHDDNVMGNVWSKTGNWVNALLSYQRALDEDPDGPFSKVIKENLDIAMTHLGPQKPKTVPTSAAAAPAVPSPTPPQEKPKEIVQSNCTGWMTANGKTSRLCMDEQAHRYCEEQSGNSVSRVSCQ
ncbi:MAG TPA: tetratricopeptide repeat protein [Pseudolabrys sp.]|nr:tetratricopeptide repeat protein [Pseudolabrys sp.]